MRNHEEWQGGQGPGLDLRYERPGLEHKQSYLERKRSFASRPCCQGVGGEVAEAVRGALRAARLAPERLELEITESVLLQQSEQVAETLRVRDLANLISSKTGCGVRNLENPRKEDAGTYIHILVLTLAPLHWLTVVT